MANETKIVLFFFVLAFLCAIPTSSSNAPILKIGYATNNMNQISPSASLKATLSGSDELSSTSDQSSNFGPSSLEESMRGVPGGPDPIHN